MRRCELLAQSGERGEVCRALPLFVAKALVGAARKQEIDGDGMTKALLAAFEKHPVGRLRLSPKTFGAGEPVEFLGHCLTPCEGGVRIAITDANKRKFEHRMKAKLRSLAKTKRKRARREALHDIKQDIQSWAAAFTLCDDTQKIRSY